MRSRPSWPSSSPSSIDRLGLVAAVAGALALGGCGGNDDECGPGGEPADGISVAAEGEAIVFDQFVSSANNDCTPTDEAGPTSLTVQGAQTGREDDGFFILCLPRPDQLGDGAFSLTDEDRVQVIDLVGHLPDGCELDLDRERSVSGQITFSGVCDDGAHPDGYAMFFAANVPLTRACPGEAPQPVEAEVTGRAEVSVR